MKAFSRLWRRYTLGLFVLLLLTGCVALPPPPRLTPYPPYTCESFTESYWSEFRFDTDSSYELEDVVAKIVELWDLENSQIKLDVQGKYVRASWPFEFADEADGTYVAHFHEDTKLSAVFFHWRNRRPTITEVIGCLGDPEYYVAYYQLGSKGEAIIVHLWYVDRGFVVRGISFPGWDKPAEITPEYQMTDFSASEADDLERMISKLHRPAVHSFFICEIRPWPSSIEEIEVESHSYSSARCR